MRRFFLKLTGSSILCGVLLFLWGYHAFHAPGPTDQVRIYDLVRGQSLTQIEQGLRTQGLIRHHNLFRIGVILSGYGRGLQAGEFAIPERASMADIMRILARGKVIQHQLTLVEGWTSWKIAAYLNALEPLSGPPVVQLAEGSILPDSYLYTRGTDRQTLIRRMQAASRDFLATAWADRAPDLPLSSAAEAVILASIVEKETARPEERAHIAGVFLNRLRKGMRLQTDPTVIYGLDQRGFLGRPLTRADLRADNPYNSYRISGLPPTPISHPSRLSILAVLHPDKTNDLYFVADGTGGHAFARTLEAHQENVQKWRRLEKKNNSR